MKPFTKEEAYNWAATRCAQKEYCRMELMQKFMQRGLSRPDCEEVLEKLEREGFVDEARYARAFVHDKTLYNHWGRMKTRQALAIKNIANEHIEQASTDYECAQKLLRFAAGRGFEADLVFRVMGED